VPSQLPAAQAPEGYRNRPVSWVRRGVRMTDGQEAAWQQHGHKYLIEPPRSISRESIAPGWQLDLINAFSPVLDPAICACSAHLPQDDDERSSSFCGHDAEASGSAESRKVVIEIGTGRGENIVSAAAREPHTHFLGVEVYGPGLARAILLAESAGTGVPVPHLGPGIAEAIASADVTQASPTASFCAESAVADGVAESREPRPSLRSAQNDGVWASGLSNLRLIQVDAPELLDSLPEGSVDEFWVFFPDPWPKTRHFKRRMIDADFATQIARVLKPGGIIRLATDWAHYAEQMQEVFTASSDFQQIPTERFEGRVLTAFETKGIREGRSITDLAYQKV